MPEWWSSYGQFDADASGLHPQARQVVAHYRQIAGWSQEHLARMLGLKTSAQYYAEHEGRGLDSITRLRALRTLLGIPPTLLGICDAPESGAWWSGDYEPWPAGQDGWPETAAVIKWYRKARGWNQSNLAEALGIQKLGVVKMEKAGSGLDSLSRRRALKFLLNIPPVLIGLDTRTYTNIGHNIHVTTSRPGILPLDVIKDAQQKLWAGYYNGHGLNQLKHIDWASYQPEALLPLLPTKDREAYIEQTSLLFQAAGNIVLARADQRQVLAFMNTGIRYARLSDDKDLLSTALGRRAAALYELGAQELAEHSIRESLAVASPQEARKRYPVASRVLSLSAEDRQDRLEVYSMLDQIIVNDRYQNGVDENIILWCRAQVLTNLAIKAPNRADLLSQASDLLDRATTSAPNTLRRKLIIKVEQARAYMGLREYDYAVTTAIEAFGLMKKLNSVLYIPQLAEIYNALQQSSYATSPQLAHLGLLLLQAGCLK